MINNEIQYDIDGLVNTIISYTCNQYIISYAQQLQVAIGKDESALVKELSDRILKWYKQEIITINNNRFIYDKDAHVKSIIILEELSQLV